VLWPGVQYLTGQWFDLPRLARATHASGAALCLDLAHAIGNVPLALHDWNVDCAAWCSYKYLNGGPGAIGGLYVHQRHGEQSPLPRLCGWWGQEPHTRFQMGPTFVLSPAQPAGAQQSAHPVDRATAGVAGAVPRRRTGRVAHRSLALTAYLRRCCCGYAAIGCNSSHRRSPASVVVNCLRSGNAAQARAVFTTDCCRAVCRRLARTGHHPADPVLLYNSFSGVHRAVTALAELCERRDHHYRRRTGWRAGGAAAGASRAAYARFERHRDPRVAAVNAAALNLALAARDLRALEAAGVMPHPPGNGACPAACCDKARHATARLTNDPKSSGRSAAPTQPRTDRGCFRHPLIELNFDQRCVGADGVGCSGSATPAAARCARGARN
jgi:hypothetical protein